jgi:hypothetical protein
MNASVATLSPTEIADQIVVTVHPSALELGPIAGGIVRDRAGRAEFHPDRLTRLSLPGSPTGFGTRWIDYETARDALDALARARRVVLAEATPEAASAALVRWYEAE